MKSLRKYDESSNTLPTWTIQRKWFLSYFTCQTHSFHQCHLFIGKSLRLPLFVVCHIIPLYSDLLKFSYKPLNRTLYAWNFYKNSLLCNLHIIYNARRHPSSRAFQKKMLWINKGTRIRAIISCWWHLFIPFCKLNEQTFSWRTLEVLKSKR